MDRDKIKMAAAIAVLVGAVGLLSVQIVGRQKAASRSGGPDAPLAVMESEAQPAATVARAVAWEPPAEGLEELLRRNPFLPVKASPRMAAAVSGPRKPGSRSFRVTGIRTGTPKTAIINDRILAEGETVSGWRVLRIDRSRVTLRNVEGRTIRLAAK